MEALGVVLGVELDRCALGRVERFRVMRVTLSGAGTAQRMGRGHRAVSRVADVVVEAWADGREECLAEVVQALVESCARAGDAVPDACVMFALAEETDEALLTAVLDEVIRQIEANGRVTVDVSVDERTGATRGQVEVRLATVPVEAVERVATAPAALAVHGVRFGCEDGVWRARLHLAL